MREKKRENSCGKVPENVYSYLTQSNRGGLGNPGGRFLGKWEAAQMDLGSGQGIDFDESTAAVQKVVAERYKKIQADKVRWCKLKRVEKTVLEAPASSD